MTLDELDEVLRGCLGIIRFRLKFDMDSSGSVALFVQTITTPPFSGRFSLHVDPRAHRRNVAPDCLLHKGIFERALSNLWDDERAQFKGVNSCVNYFARL